MRLIDADALTEEIQENMKNGFPANEYLSLYAISCIAHAPTVDAVPMSVIEDIRAEIEETIESYVCDKEENTMKAQGMLNAMLMTFEIIDKYKGDKE